MDLEQLYEQLKYEQKKDDFSSLKDSDKSKLSSGTSNGEMNTIETRERPKTLFDIERAVEEILSIRARKNNKDDLSLQEKENELWSYLSDGILIDELPLRDEVVSSISAFLGRFGYSDEFIDNGLGDISLFTSSIEVIHEGLLVSFGNKVGIDYKFLDFDQDGKFIGIKEDKKNFLLYTVAHEFFHKLSLFSSDRKDAMMDDAFSEGITDMLAHIVSGNYSDKSDRYDFPVKVCTLFTEMIGMDKVLDDYLHNIDSLPNLVNMFQESELSEEEFRGFRNTLTSVISVSRQDSKDGKNPSEYALGPKSECLEFLQSNLLVSFCEKHPDKAPRVIQTFNELFKDYGVHMEFTPTENKSK